MLFKLHLRSLEIFFFISFFVFFKSYFLTDYCTVQIIDNYVIDAPADSLSEKKRKGREIISFVYLKYSFRGPKKIGALRSVKSYPRVTVTLKELIDLIEKVKSQKMFFILSTSQGIMHHRDAMQLGIGGQIVYSVV